MSDFEEVRLEDLPLFDLYTERELLEQEREEMETVIRSIKSQLEESGLQIKQLQDQGRQPTAEHLAWRYRASTKLRCIRREEIGIVKDLARVNRRIKTLEHAERKENDRNEFRDAVKQVVTSTQWEEIILILESNREKP